MVLVASSDTERLAVLIDSDNTTDKRHNRVARRDREVRDADDQAGLRRLDHAAASPAGRRSCPATRSSPCSSSRNTHGKNATDSALIIDAMDLLYAGNVEGFVIVSSDSDYTRLATRLRESGMTVYGLGRRTRRNRSSRPVIASSISTSSAAGALASGRRRATHRRPNLKRLLSAAISSTSKDDGWSNLAEVGSYLVKSHRGFRRPRFRPPQARRARPRSALRRGQGRGQPGRAEPAVGARQDLTLV